jgi:starch-binding outer membrane protein, SusD/RagB family
MTMKIIHKYLLAGLVLFTACKKSYLDRPSLNNPTLDTYYNNPAEVNLATGFLYNQPWYNYMDKAFHCIGEVMSGNMLTSAGDANYGFNTYVYFTVQSTDGQVLNAWQSIYKVAGNATVLINTLEQKKSQVSDPSYLNLGIAEARFIRGAAYFNIARMFGDAPIVEDPVALAGSGNYNVPKYFQKDVLRFALEDFKAAETALPDVPYQPGRVTKYSAKGMEAKLYLYRGDYDSAKLKAGEVIASGKYDLYPDYKKMFTSSSANNNIESMFALQWVASGGYSYANAIQAYAGPSPLLKPDFNTGYSSVIPTLDLLNSYESGDLRRKWSVMEQGFTNPNWKNANFPNGFVYDTTWTSSSDDPYKIKTGTRSNALKYTVGPLSSGEPLNSQGGNSMNTYMLRYADVLLIYAEAVLGNNASTSDAAALSAFNKVRTRAGLTALTSLTKNIILHERRVEFAFEGDYWFDIQRQGFTRAKQILEAQERGTLNNNGTINHVGITVTSADRLFLPIPQQEVVSDPELSRPAVAYY